MPSVARLVDGLRMMLPAVKKSFPSFTRPKLGHSWMLPFGAAQLTCQLFKQPSYYSIGHMRKGGIWICKLTQPTETSSADRYHIRKINPRPFLEPVPSSTHMEEKRRAWWSFVMFDRYVSLGAWKHTVSEADIMSLELPICAVDFECEVRYIQFSHILLPV